MSNVWSEALTIEEPLTRLQRQGISSILEEVRKHSSRDYFVLKSAIVNNLYGVDIMEEAVEICKLRLFLKLVAQIEDVRHLEPLPDIDFNIRPGNTLVGFATYGDVEVATRKQRPLSLAFDSQLARLENLARMCEEDFEAFRSEQMLPTDTAAKSERKRALASRLAQLSAELKYAGL